MPRYKVTMKRMFEEIGSVVVEAGDESEAKDLAPEMIDEDGEWGSQSLEEESVESCEPFDEDE